MPTDPPSWHIRLSLEPGADAPRTTVAVTLWRRALGLYASVRLPDGKRLGALAMTRYRGQDAIQRLCRKLADQNATVWHLAPPGEVVPVDGRREIEVAVRGRPPLAQLLAELDEVRVTGKVPEMVLDVVRAAAQGGCYTGRTYTSMIGETDYSVMLTVIGEPPEDVTRELDLLGFIARRRHGRIERTWVPSDVAEAPPKRRRKARPQAAPVRSTVAVLHRGPAA